MPDSLPSILIILLALVGAILSLIVLTVYKHRFFSETKHTLAVTNQEILILSLFVGLSILLWRSVANVPELNGDPGNTLLTPNTLLCPVMTYIFLGMFNIWRSNYQSNPVEWGQIRVVLTLLSFIVNMGIR
jgi:glucose-6-phosphate-specific signal transduction histidine kinase